MKILKFGQAGVASLEAAVIFLSFTTLLSLALPLVDYINVTETLSQLVDKHLYDQVVRPFSLGREGELQVRQDEIVSAMRSVLEAASEDMLDAFGRHSDQQFIIEAGCFLLGIDPESGNILSMREAAGCGSLMRGMGRTDPQTPSLRELALGKFPAGATAGSYLVPSANYDFDKSTGAGKKLWVDRAAALGIKVSYTFERSWTAETLQLLGVLRLPVVSAFKIIPLRGEVQ